MQVMTASNDGKIVCKFRVNVKAAFFSVSTGGVNLERRPGVRHERTGEGCSGGGGGGKE